MLKHKKIETFLRIFLGGQICDLFDSTTNEPWENQEFNSNKKDFFLYTY